MLFKLAPGRLISFSIFARSLGRMIPRGLLFLLELIGQLSELPLMKGIRLGSRGGAFRFDALCVLVRFLLTRL